MNKKLKSNIIKTIKIETFRKYNQNQLKNNNKIKNKILMKEHLYHNKCFYNILKIIPNITKINIKYKIKELIITTNNENICKNCKNIFKINTENIKF